MRIDRLEGGVPALPSTAQAHHLSGPGANQRGFTSFADVEQGPKRRLRAESFAHHYSQARQFVISQTMGEQAHIAAALTFELSKVQTPAIREGWSRISIDETLATNVAGKLGLQKMPKPADAAVPTRPDLNPSPALSIVENGPERFEGRSWVSWFPGGTDAGLLRALKAALTRPERCTRSLRRRSPEPGRTTAAGSTPIK